jgi:putative protease
MGLFSFFKKSKNNYSVLNRKTSKETEIGKITHYFNHISVGIIKLKDKLKTGDKIHIKGAHDDFTQTVNSIQLDHENVESAGKGDEIGIKVKNKVHENDTVYKI